MYKKLGADEYYGQSLKLYRISPKNNNPVDL